MHVVAAIAKGAAGSLATSESETQRTGSTCISNLASRCSYLVLVGAIAVDHRQNLVDRFDDSVLGWRGGNGCDSCSTHSGIGPLLL
jgi:hypothetical protein